MNVLNNLLCLPALALLAYGCQTDELSPDRAAEAPEEQVTIAATAGTQTKTYLGTKDESSYPVYWSETGETLNLSEFITTSRSQDATSVSFTRHSTESASFNFSLTKKTDSGTYDYVAIYPSSAARTTGTAAAKKGRASFALAPTTPQVPAADGPDPAACIMTANDLGKTAQASSLNFTFRHQTAVSKMTITNFPALTEGEKVTEFRISGPEGCHISGRYWYDYSADSCTEYDGSMQDYVLVNPKNVGVNSTSFTLWWVCLPVEMAAGGKLTIKATTSKGNTYTADACPQSGLSLRKGKVSEYTFNWTKYADKVLTFDFTSLPTGWPTTLVSGTAYQYGDYSFTHYGYGTDGGEKSRCSYNSTSHFLTLNYGGFLSLPVLENHKLVKAVVLHSASKSSGRSGGIVYGTRKFTDSVEFVSPGGKGTSLWNVNPGTEVELPVLTSLKEHKYYIACTNGGLGIAGLELTYEYDRGADGTHLSDAFTAGTLNIWQPSARTSKKEAGLAPAEREWEYARYNIRDIIKDSGFDILGVQEATLRVRNDVTSDLSSTGKYAYEWFLHKTTTPSTSSSVGIIYNKNRFSISDTHHFWLSDTPDTPESVRTEENTPRSVGCGIMTDSQTGKRYFFMVAHASLDDPSNEKDAALILSRIKQYNTSDLPVILVGDMNANWSMPLYESFSGQLDDSRFLTELNSDEYYHPGTHNGAAGVDANLTQRASRIDFVFTKGVNVYDYRVNRTKYTAGSTVQYPSDHCPVVVKMY